MVSEILSGWMKEAFVKALPDADISRVTVQEAANPAFGDYQCNEAMGIAKGLRKPPRDVAASVIAAAGAHPLVASLEIAGPGFINIRLKDDGLIESLEKMVCAERMGVPDDGAGQCVVIDYSSPNIAKPMHIGHIRSTIIGNALDRLYRRLGYRVIADNHIGDWGTQFGIIIMGYRHFADQEALQRAPVEELERIYVKSYEKTREDEAWMEQCRAELVKLQAGDPDNLALWEKFIELSLGEFDRVYRRLGVSFDLIRGESYYRDKLAGLLERLEHEGLAVESEGARVVMLEEEGLPLCIVRKRDGGFNYATSDIATVLSREDEFSPACIIYVTDERQQLHFKQVFSICRKLGCETPLMHVWFGLMRLPEGTFSTRQGNVIKLEALLDEAEARALKIVKESSPDMPEAQQREVARAVGLGAVKYADLSQNPQTMITFTWEKALALDGNSAPYLQYACARICSVREKYVQQFGAAGLQAAGIMITHPAERELVLQLLRYPDIVRRAALLYKPSVLADGLYAIAQKYSTFYQNVPFLKADSGVRESRIRLCAVTAQILQDGLALLGIETPERI